MLLEKHISNNPKSKTLVLFGGSPIRRDEVIRSLREIEALSIYGTLNEEEGYEKISELPHTDIVLIGGRYTDSQRLRIREFVYKNYPETKITEPGIDYPYETKAIFNKIKQLILSFVLILFVSNIATAQNDTASRTFAIETNPLAFAFGGWSAGFAYHPSKAKHWVFNSGLYAFELPETFVEQIPGNEGEGWNVKIKTAFTIGADYYPWRDDRSGFAFGLSTVLAQFEITNDSEIGKANYNSLYFVPRASYTWFAYKGLYLMPWLGVELHTQLNGSTTVGSQEYEPMKFQFSHNLTIGYAFK